MNDATALKILKVIHEELTHELKSITKITDLMDDIYYTNPKIYVDAIKLARHSKERSDNGRR